MRFKRALHFCAVAGVYKCVKQMGNVFLTPTEERGRCVIFFSPLPSRLSLSKNLCIEKCVCIHIYIYIYIYAPSSILFFASQPVRLRSKPQSQSQSLSMSLSLSKKIFFDKENFNCFNPTGEPLLA